MKKFLSLIFLLTLVFAAKAGVTAELPDFTQLAAKCGPAVVNINTERKNQSGGPDDLMGEMFKNLPPGFEKFFEQFGGQGRPDGKNRNRRAPHRQRSLGSGFFVSADGYIVTNFHVVNGAEVIKVTMDDQNGKSRNMTAKLIGSDEETDLALLKVDGEKNFPYLEFGNSNDMKVGQWVLAIGNPFGLDHTVTAGIVSATGRNIHSGPFDNFLQTDASINPGNSGGPLLNMAGQVIGINTAIIASGQGIGFAIPSDMAARIIDQIKDGKKISRGWIGVTIQDVDENTAKALGMEDGSGALIGSVLPGEPAEKAGLKDGDVILAVDDKSIENSSALLRAIADKAPGSSAVLTVFRDGKTMNITVTLGERKPGSIGRGGSRDEGREEGELGVTLRSLTEKERQENKIDGKEGLMIVSVDPDKAAAEAELRAGDIILKANMQPVASPEELSRIVKEIGSKRGAVMLQVKRGDNTFFRAITFNKAK